MELIRELFDLTDPKQNVLFNMSEEEARACVLSGDPVRVRSIAGHFALVARTGNIIRMARSLGVLMRYFIVKRHDGPALLVSDRIDAIEQWLRDHNYHDQFHPSYTRMIPAHHITELSLLGCPDPNPVCTRFLAPQREVLEADPDVIGKAYISALGQGLDRYLDTLNDRAPIGVCFSGGIDSGAVFLMLYHLMRRRGMNLGRLKAFTLSVDGGGADLDQSRRFLEALDLSVFHEPVEVPLSHLDIAETIRVMEDYKPLDVQAGAMILALARGVRERYPDWTYLVDGDGGDENLKDYPLEDNPELTIRSVLSNLMLYHEGWGVDSIKHSLTYSGGLSRGYARTYAPMNRYGFRGFSPFALPDVVEVAEGIPFIELTDWSHERLYSLKGEVVSRGIHQVTGMSMPVYEKRRMQHGAVDLEAFSHRFADDQRVYRRAFNEMFHV